MPTIDARPATVWSTPPRLNVPTLALVACPSESTVVTGRRLLPAVSWMVPLEIVVAPVYVLEPPSESVPPPCLTHEPVVPEMLAMTPSYVSVPEPAVEIDVPAASPTVMLRDEGMVNDVPETMPNRPPLITILFAAFPRLPLFATRTSAPVNDRSPVNVLDVPVMSNRPAPDTEASAPGAAANVIPPLVFAMTPPNVTLPLLPSISVRFAAPRDMALENVRFAVSFASATFVENSPNCTLPPMVIPPAYLSVRLRVALPATAPPLSANAPPPPIAFTPRRMTVPALSVNPPV